MTLRWDMSKPIDINEKTGAVCRLRNMLKEMFPASLKTFCPGFPHIIHIHDHHVWEALKGVISFLSPVNRFFQYTAF